jgi:hypothetical protein
VDHVLTRNVSTMRLFGMSSRKRPLTSPLNSEKSPPTVAMM